MKCHCVANRIRYKYHQYCKRKMEQAHQGTIIQENTMNPNIPFHSALQDNQTETEELAQLMIITSTTDGRTDRTRGVRARWMDG
jgi:uncharacterized membrane protein YebE (DUF533 family)